MNQEETQGSRSRGELEMELIAMLRQMAIPIIITRHENAGFSAEYQWEALHLHGARHSFVEVLQDALIQTMGMLLIMDQVPLPLPPNLRANMSDENVRWYEARRERKLQERRDLGFLEEQ